ncbi:lytic transglycosylase domain-containing protein [Streptomyces sp. NPDC050804]|uniref:lytic transglycosylase domain-containing protein n=1 Tax=Streptomyces sp. NPDC050804 TaxID=3154745 RepID=UPI003429120E
MSDAGENGQAKSGSAAALTAMAGGCGCLALPAGFAVVSLVIIVLGGLGVLLLPLIVIILFFLGLPTGTDFDDLSPAEQRCETAERLLGAEAEDQAERVQAIFLGDGKGIPELSPGDDGGGGQSVEPCTVPAELFQPIVDAGSVCDVIGPVAIAAQIQYETQFDADFVGPNGAQGISQVPPDIFAELNPGGDPFDVEQSIVVQGAYLCSLAEQVQQLVDTGQVTGGVLDLALTAYDVGIDAVREAGGVPATEDSQSYVVGVRSWFAPIEGVGPPPRKIPAQPGLSDSGPEPEPGARPPAEDQPGVQPPAPEPPGA